jgi:hypothetical protein
MEEEEKRRVFEFIKLSTALFVLFANTFSLNLNSFSYYALGIINTSILIFFNIRTFRNIKFLFKNKATPTKYVGLLIGLFMGLPFHFNYYTVENVGVNFYFIVINQIIIIALFASAFCFKTIPDRERNTMV